MTGPARHQGSTPLYADPVRAELVGTGLFYGLLALPVSLILALVGLVLSRRRAELAADEEFAARFRGPRERHPD
jgi:hypothetical protein